MDDAATRERRWGRLTRRMAFSFSAANIAGALILFVFVGLIMPTPDEVAGDWTFFWINLALLVPTIVVATVVANWLGRRAAEPVRRWFVTGEAPDERGRAAALHQPVAQMKGGVVVWTGGTVLFAIVNAFISVPLAGLIVLGALMGGIFACALTYLLAERLGRDVTAVALASGVPEEPVGPRVATRILLAWAMAAGIPLLGGALLAIAVLGGADVSRRQIAVNVLFLAVFGLTFGLLAMRIAARSVADPVEDVRAALREVQAGDLDASVPVYDGSEVGLLQAGFNRMADGLRERERLQDLFGRHVGREVAQRALDRGVELGGEAREAAALFVDLVGSTTLAATRPPGEVVEILNRFFAVVVEATHRHQGWVNKFEGDAALCVFGAPEDPGGAPARALAAAREMAGRLAAEVPEVRAAIGVSWGPVVAGNVGAAERYEYTVIGDPVNEAARLSDLAKEREGVLASEAIVSAAGGAEAARWTVGDSVTLRGRAEPTRLASPA